jgi:transposase
VHAAVHLLRDIFWPTDTVIGGGNAKVLDPLPAECRRTSNLDGIIGAARLWKGADMYAELHGTTWRIQAASRAKLLDRERLAKLG